MSDKPKFPFEQARKVAAEILNRMLPHCDDILVAGSLRRGKPYVGDIELLYVPKVTVHRDGLFEGENTCVNLTDNFLVKLMTDGVIEKRPNVNGHFAWGVNNKLGRHVASGIPLDFFATTRENWFVSLVIRTGSKDTNLLLTTGAQRLGRKLNAYGCGVTGPDGTVIPATSEKHVFQLCGVPYREPKDR